MNDQETIEPSSSPSGGSKLFAMIGVLILALIAAGCWWFVTQSTSRKAEAEAVEAIKALGALTTMDANREYVASLNTITLNDPDKFKEVMAHTAKLTRLQILDLSKSAVTSEQLAALSGLSQLTTLQLNKTSTSDDDIRHFHGMKVLESLYVGDTKITDKALAEIAKIKSLTILDLSNNDLKDLGSLAALPKLTWLVLQNETALSDEKVSALGTIASLRRLSLHAEQISEEQRSRLTDLNPLLKID
jgi:hypothetical protein